MSIDPTVQKRLDELNAQVKTTHDETMEIINLFDQLPDLEITYDRWKVKRYSSLEVNARATKYYTGYSCGCCSDSPLFLYPFIELDGIRVHTKPVRFYIGERCEYTEDGIRYDTDCLEEMKKQGLSSILIDEVKLLVTRPPLYLDDSDADEIEGYP